MESLEDFFVDSGDNPYYWREDESESADNDNDSEEESRGANAAKMPEAWEPAGTSSLVPRPRFPTAAVGLHHRYVESGSGILSITQSLCRHINGVSYCVVINELSCCQN